MFDDYQNVFLNLYQTTAIVHVAGNTRSRPIYLKKNVPFVKDRLFCLRPTIKFKSA